MKRTSRRTVLLKGGDMKRISRETALLKGKQFRCHLIKASERSRYNYWNDPAVRLAKMCCREDVDAVPQGSQNYHYHPKVCYGMLY